MTTTRRATAAASAATVLVLGGLWFGTTDALAADDPSVDSVKTEIAALVCADLDADVVKVRADIGILAAAGLTDADEATLNGLLDDKVKALDCDAPTTTPAPTTTVPPTTTPPVYGDDKDCSDFADAESAQHYFDAVTTAANPDPSKLDADGDGIACELSERPVDPRADDGSQAATDGTQVITVPRGSAPTGED